ncbi:MAG: hypothetical protein ACRDJI_03350, partial [Actinomycetota bacterium]
MVRALIAVILGAVSAGALAIPSHSSTGTGAGFFVAHFHRRITDDARARLERTGVTIIDYEPINSYL